MKSFRIVSRVFASAGNEDSVERLKELVEATLEGDKLLDYQFCVEWIEEEEDTIAKGI